jgi:hypothetical protein
LTFGTGSYYLEYSDKLYYYYDYDYYCCRYLHLDTIQLYLAQTTHFVYPYCHSLGLYHHHIPQPRTGFAATHDWHIACTPNPRQCLSISQHPPISFQPTRASFILPIPLAARVPEMHIPHTDWLAGTLPAALATQVTISYFGDLV